MALPLRQLLALMADHPRAQPPPLTFPLSWELKWRWASTAPPVSRPPPPLPGGPRPTCRWTTATRRRRPRPRCAPSSPPGTPRRLSPPPPRPPRSVPIPVPPLSLFATTRPRIRGKGSGSTPPIIPAPLDPPRAPLDVLPQDLEAAAGTPHAAPTPDPEAPEVRPPPRRRPSTPLPGTIASLSIGSDRSNGFARRSQGSPSKEDTVAAAAPPRAAAAAPPPEVSPAVLAVVFFFLDRVTQHFDRGGPFLLEPFIKTTDVVFLGGFFFKVENMFVFGMEKHHMVCHRGGGADAFACHKKGLRNRVPCAEEGARSSGRGWKTGCIPHPQVRALVAVPGLLSVGHWHIPYAAGRARSRGGRSHPHPGGCEARCP